MLDLAARLAREEAEADPKEFIIGATGNGVNFKSLAAGVLATSLLLKVIK